MIFDLLCHCLAAGDSAFINNFFKCFQDRSQRARGQSPSRNIFLLEGWGKGVHAVNLHIIFARPSLPKYFALASTLNVHNVNSIENSNQKIKFENFFQEKELYLHYLIAPL